MSEVCLIPVLPRGGTNIPESTTRELTSLRYPSCSTGFLETVIVLVKVALPVSSVLPSVQVSSMEVGMANLVHL